MYANSEGFQALAITMIVILHALFLDCPQPDKTVIAASTPDNKAIRQCFAFFILLFSSFFPDKNHNSIIPSQTFILFADYSIITCKADVCNPLRYLLMQKY